MCLFVYVGEQVYLSVASVLMYCSYFRLFAEKTSTFQSLHSTLLRFVCLTLKSSLRSHRAHRERAARSPSHRPNGCADPSV